MTTHHRPSATANPDYLAVQIQAANTGPRRAILEHRLRNKCFSRRHQAELLRLPIGTLRNAEYQDRWPEGLAGRAVRTALGIDEPQS